MDNNEMSNNEMKDLMENLVDAHERQADAMEKLAKVFEEFLYCTCTYNSLGEGHAVNYPTINVRIESDNGELPFE